MLILIKRRIFFNVSHGHFQFITIYQWLEGVVQTHFFFLMTLPISLLMASLSFRKKQKHGCQFSRGSLDQEYNPKVNIYKKQAAFMSPIPDKDRHSTKEKQSRDASDKALKSLKRGCKLLIDWKQPDDFRATLRKNTLRRLRTQAMPRLMHASLQQRRIELAKLLHVRNRKSYMRSKRDLEEERQLFGKSQMLGNSRSTDSKQEVSLFKREKSHRRSSRSKTVKDFEKAQDRLLKDSKLELLQEELRQKLIEIRNMYKKHHYQIKRSKVGFEVH